MNNIVFTSVIAQYLEDFVAMKQSIGYKYEAEKLRIKSLDNACSMQLSCEACLDKETVEKWTKRKPNEKTTTYLRRIHLSNEIAEYLLKRGVSAYIIAPEHISATKIEKYIPYIFSQEELKAFFHAADLHLPHRAHPISNIQYSVLFRLLYSCGLRISEALRLTYRDVCVENKTLLIANSKFGKDRIVPMSETTCRMLQEYIQLVKEHNFDNVYIFPSRFSNEPIRSRSAYEYFRRILWEAGIPHGGKGKGPRIHDFRHTFAVCSLRQLVNSGMDVYTALPILATYLGHNDIAVTERYVRLTADIFPEILARIDSYCNTIIPEVLSDEND